MPTESTEPTHPDAAKAAPSTRLAVHRSGADPSTVDGGWWPRSWNAAAELPGLVRALAPRIGPVGSVVLNRATWTGDIERLSVDGRTVRVGWSDTLDPALAVVAAERGRLELLVVPPPCAREAAERLLGEAWRGTNALPAEILAGG